MIRKENGGFDRIHDNAGPGKSLTTYLPKEDSLVEELRPSLTPSDASAAVADPRGGDRQRGNIKLKEKRLDARLWRYKGQHQRGSHFPICVFTNNVGRRSPQKLEERKEKNKSRDHGTSGNGPKAREQRKGSREQRNGKACKNMQIRSKVNSRDQRNTWQTHSGRGKIIGAGAEAGGNPETVAHGQVAHGHRHVAITPQSRLRSR